MENLVNEAIEELMQADNGYNPNSSIPFEQQLEKKRAEYQKLLELSDLKSKIQKAVELIQKEIKDDMLLEELADAAEMLSIQPLRISQKTFDTLFVFGKDKFEQGQVEDACAIFTLLTVLGPGWFRHWLYLGATLQELKEYKEAIEAYKNAISIMEEEPLSHLFTAECFLDLSDKQQAAVHLEKAKSNIQDNPDLKARVSIIEQRLK